MGHFARHGCWAKGPVSVQYVSMTRMKLQLAYTGRPELQVVVETSEGWFRYGKGSSLIVTTQLLRLRDSAT